MLLAPTGGIIAHVDRASGVTYEGSTIALAGGSVLKKGSDDLPILVPGILYSGCSLKMDGEFLKVRIQAVTLNQISVHVTNTNGQTVGANVLAGFKELPALEAAVTVQETTGTEEITSRTYDRGVDDAGQAYSDRSFPSMSEYVSWLIPVLGMTGKLEGRGLSQRAHDQSAMLGAMIHAIFGKVQFKEDSNLTACWMTNLRVRDPVQTGFDFDMDVVAKGHIKCERYTGNLVKVSFGSKVVWYDYMGGSSTLNLRYRKAVVAPGWKSLKGRFTTPVLSGPPSRHVALVNSAESELRISVERHFRELDSDELEGRTTWSKAEAMMTALSLHLPLTPSQVRALTQIPVSGADVTAEAGAASVMTSIDKLERNFLMPCESEGRAARDPVVQIRTITELNVGIEAKCKAALATMAGVVQDRESMWRTAMNKICKIHIAARAAEAQAIDRWSVDTRTSSGKQK